MGHGKKIGCKSKPDFYLVSINSAAENSCIHQHIKGSGGRWWIGYNDRTTEGIWKWVTNGGLYSSWRPGEPNNANNNEDCAVIRSNDGLWNDRRCTETVKYICERND